MTGTEAYFYLVLPAFLFSLWASFNVKSTFKKYSSVLAKRRITSEQAVNAVLTYNNVYGVATEYVRGELTDHYDPGTNTIRLSQTVSGLSSIAAIGVAAHEAGHAVQYGKSYSLIKLRSAIIPVCQIGSNAAMPLIIAGIFFSFNFLIQLGIIFFGASVLFQLVTLPVEFDASRRAVTALKAAGILDAEELTGAKKVLTAAALTYVAALAAALANFIRLIAMFSRRNSR